MSQPTEFHTYVPRKVRMSALGVRMRGFGDGTFIEASRDNPTFTKKKGAHGDTTRVQSHDKGGKVIVRVLKESSVNAELSALLKADEDDGDQTGELIIEDDNGALCHAHEAWLEGQPAPKWSKEGELLEYTFDCHEFDIFISGGG